MAILGFIAYALIVVADLWIVVKLFQKKGVLHGILGLIFPIYPFIWGIIHFKDAAYGVKTPMWIWFAGIVLTIIANALGGAPAVEPSAFLPFFM